MLISLLFEWVSRFAIVTALRSAYKICLALQRMKMAILYYYTYVSIQAIRMQCYKYLKIITVIDFLPLNTVHRAYPVLPSLSRVHPHPEHIKLYFHSLFQINA